MRVGMIGLGKLGLPVATAMASRGLEVWGYDPHVIGFPENTDHEQGFAEAIQAGSSNVVFCKDADTVVKATDGVVFVAVQTPHEKQFEGVTPLPDERRDFDYSYLTEAVDQINSAAIKQRKDVALAVISTVLPGTIRREIEPRVCGHVSLVYNPSFIAMGTTIPDFLDPEFVLVGGGDNTQPVRDVYRAVLFERGEIPPPLYHTSIANAELIKVAYNTFIGLKIVFANTLMEICHKTQANADAVTLALQMANRRLISPAYMDGGMGDGGGCHPRDNIALSWLARELDLSHDLFEDVMKCREDQAEWLADLMLREQADPINRFPDGGHRLKPGLGILGTAYKPSSAITTGSPAKLVAEILRAAGSPAIEVDPHVNPQDEWGVWAYPRVWLVGCKHPEFEGYEFPEGSVVIDPFRYIPDQQGVRVIRVGA